MPIVLNHDHSSPKSKQFSRELKHHLIDNRATEEDIEFFTSKISQLENELNKVARKLFITIKQTPEAPRFNSQLSIIQRNIDELNKVIDKQSSINAEIREIIECKKEHLYETCEEIGNYDILKDVCVFIDSSSVTGYKKRIHENDDNESLNNNYKSMKEFTLNVKNAVAEIYNNSSSNNNKEEDKDIDYETFLDKWLGTLYKHEMELE